MQDFGVHTMYKCASFRTSESVHASHFDIKVSCAKSSKTLNWVRACNPSENGTYTSTIFIWVSAKHESETERRIFKKPSPVYFLSPNLYFRGDYDGVNFSRLNHIKHRLPFANTWQLCSRAHASAFEYYIRSSRKVDVDAEKIRIVIQILTWDWEVIRQRKVD